MATLGTEVAIVERFKQEPMYGLSVKKVAVVERWSLVEVELYFLGVFISRRSSFVFFPLTY